MHKVVFYLSPDGKTSPVENFLNYCQPRLRVKTLRQFQYVQDFGLNPTIPNIKKIKKTPLWELRILGRDNVRIFCFSLKTGEVVVLHIFVKKKQKTPQKELSTALRRAAEIVDK